MKIAIATDGGAVAQHFGHCEGFTLYEVENGTAKEEKFIPNPGHQPGFLPNFLHEQGAKAVIAGGMGDGAIRIFREHGIAVITGISGSKEQAIERYSRGELVSGGSVCHEHSHAGSCGGHA
jgi:predicted Fe-Mo cluster-binding NifX family protein